MPLAIPLRPFARAPGAVDRFIAIADTPHIPNEAAPGVRVQLAGWIVDTDNDAVEHAWVDIGGCSISVPLDQNRLDVARNFATSDREGRRLGFEAVVVLPADITPGTYDARVIGRTRARTGVYAENAQRVSIASPRIAPRTNIRSNGDVRFDLRLRDTQPAVHTLGRGAYTVRQESSLRISGYVEDALRIHAVARSKSGETVAWEFACGQGGRFDALLWTGDLERGLYELALCRIDGDGVTAVARCGFDIAGPHYLPPLHLTTMEAPPAAEIITFADAGPAQAGSAESPLVSGRPIGISGWCLDPASSTPPLAVYAAVDELRPVPLSHHVPDPRPGREPNAVLCGFGGIIDTTRLEAGEHRLRILAAAVSGAGWYVVDDRRIVLHDHRAIA